MKWLSQMKSLFGPLAIQLVWYILKQLFSFLPFYWLLQISSTGVNGQCLGELAGHSNALMFSYVNLISNGSCYSVVLLLLLTDHISYNNYNEFNCHVPFTGSST